MGPLHLWLPDAIAPVPCTPQELGAQLKFKFISRLLFESNTLFEKILKDSRYQKISQLSREYGKKYRHQIENQETVAATIKWIGNSVGFGLFTDNDLLNGTFIGEYLGLIRHNDGRDGTNDYLFGYPILDDHQRNLVIDGRSKGNHCRFINHSKAPNLKAYTVFDDQIHHVIFIAAQDIPAGGQLSFDYGAAYWEERQPPEVF